MESVFDIIVDTQNDFMRSDGKLYVPDAEMLIEPLQHFLDKLSDHDSVGVLFTFDTHFAATYPQTEEAKQFPLHCDKDTSGWQLAVKSSVIIPSYRMEKGVFDMWHEPSLRIKPFHDSDHVGFDRDGFFAGLSAAGIKTLRMCGVAADYCLMYAIDGAVKRGFRVEVVRHLTKGIERGITRVVNENFADRSVTLV